MRKNKLILALCILSFTSSYGQKNNGYLGKKTIFDFNFGIYNPFLFNLQNDFRKMGVAKGSGVEYKSDKIDLNYNFSLTRSLSSKVSIGFEFGIQKLDFANQGAYEQYVLLDSGSFNYDQYTIVGDFEKLEMQYHYFIPKFEFKSRSRIFGVGLSHQLGMGFGRGKLKEKNYGSNLRNADTGEMLTQAEADQFNARYYDYSRNEYKNMFLMYTLTIRNPISKSIFFNYGFRYKLNLFGGATDYQSFETQLETDDVGYIFRKDRANSFLQLNLGLSFIF